MTPHIAPIIRGASIAVLFILPGAANAASLKLQSIEAFSRHLCQLGPEAEPAAGAGSEFLWSTASAEIKRRIADGEIEVRPATGNGATSVPSGLLHDWTGAVFIPGVTLEETLAAVQQYGSYRDYYAAEVLDSKLLKRDGHNYDIYLRLRKTNIVTVVLDTAHSVRYERPGPRRAQSSSCSTRIQEVENAGKADESLVATGNDHGFLWRLNSYWRFEETPEGVFAESRVVALTRGVPFGLGWLIMPIVRSLPRNSLRETLENTRAAVLAYHEGRTVSVAKLEGNAE
jgi:hypothetical protein